MSISEQEDYQLKAQKHKEAFEKKLAAAKIEKGLLIVYTGSGKGKSTAAFGMGVRILGHGMKLGVVQFIKGVLHTAERDFFGAHQNCDFYTIGDGYTWNTQDPEADRVTARKAWDKAVEMITSDNYDMVILDELNIVLKHGYVPLIDVLSVFQARRPSLHIVATGRNAPDELIEKADLVSQIMSVKHPYREQGVKAQKGVEF